MFYKVQRHSKACRTLSNPLFVTSIALRRIAQKRSCIGVYVIGESPFRRQQAASVIIPLESAKFAAKRQVYQQSFFQIY